MTSESQSAEDLAILKGMGQAIAILRDQRNISRDEFAAQIEESRETLEKIERGAVNASWGTLRAIARSLSLPLEVLVELAEESAPGAGGEAWRRSTQKLRQEKEAAKVLASVEEGG